MHSMQNDEPAVPIEQEKSEDAPALDGKTVGLSAIDDTVSGTAVNPGIALSVASEPLGISVPQRCEASSARAFPCGMIAELECVN